MHLKFCALLVLCLGSASPAFAGLEEGKAAYDAGDFETAKQEWHPLAEAGDAEAQFWMGKLYPVSKEDRANLDKAINWYSLAAEQNHTGAQHELAKLLSLKKPHSINLVKVTKWLTIITYQHESQKAQKTLNYLKDSLPHKLYNEGIKQGEEWLKSHSIEF